MPEPRGHTQRVNPLNQIWHRRAPSALGRGTGACNQDSVLGPSWKRHFIWHFGTDLVLDRPVWSQLWCHSQPVPAPLAAPFVTVAYFYAFLALLNRFWGVHKLFRNTETATKRAKNVRVRSPVCIRASVEEQSFGPRFIPFWYPNGSIPRVPGACALSKCPDTPQKRVKNTSTGTPDGPGFLFRRVWTQLGGHMRPKTPQTAAKQAYDAQKPRLAVRPSPQPQSLP